MLASNSSALSFADELNTRLAVIVGTALFSPKYKQFREHMEGIDKFTSKLCLGNTHLGLDYYGIH